MPGLILLQPNYSCTNSRPFHHFMSKWMQQLSLFAIKRLSSRGRWQRVRSKEWGLARRGKMYWTSSCLEGGEKNLLSLSQICREAVGCHPRHLSRNRISFHTNRQYPSSLVQPYLVKP